MDYLQHVFDDLSNSLGDYLPGTIAAILILITGWFIARFLRGLTSKLIKRTPLDEKLGTSKITLSKLMAQLVYFLIMIFVFMLALEKLGMASVLDPVKNMLSGFTDYIPNMVGAGLVGYIGYMLATVVAELVGLSGNTIQKFVPKLNLPENINLVTILKKLVFIFIFIPLLITALNILNMNAISDPATMMLQQFFNAIPKILLATVILIFFVVGGRFISQLLKELLQSLKLNSLLERMNLSGISSKTDVPKLIGHIAYFFIVLLGLMTAIEKLEFQRLTDVLNTVVDVSGNILFGLVILIIGNWLASIAHGTMAKNKNNAFIAQIIRVSIVAIFLAMGLKMMGIGDDIINMAFGITLGTIAVTIALSFGLGGREAGGKQMERILKKFNNTD